MFEVRVAMFSYAVVAIYYYYCIRVIVATTGNSEAAGRYHVPGDRSGVPSKQYRSIE